MASSQSNPFSTQQLGSGSRLRLATSLTALATRCFGSQNCRARPSAIRPSVLPLGGLQSVGRIGSQTTRTRTLRFASCASNRSAAEAPRRQPGHVGESSSTSLGTSASPSNAFSNWLKSAPLRVSNGCWPAGTDEGPHKYTASTSTTIAAATKSNALLLISLSLRNGLQ